MYFSIKWIRFFYRYVVQGTRKRGPLNAKKRPAPVTGSTGNGGCDASNEERAKMVKSKKMRLLIVESLSLAPSSSGGSESSSSPPPSSSRKKLSSTSNLGDISYKVSNESPSVSENVRKSSRIKARTDRKAKAAGSNELKGVDSNDIAVVKIKARTDRKAKAAGSDDLKEADSSNIAVVKIKTVRKSSKLTSSKKSIDVKLPLFCHHCEFSCGRKTSMRKHIRIYHPIYLTNQEVDPNRSVFSCAICLKTFSRKTNLRKHVFRHDLSNGKAGNKSANSSAKLKKGYCCDICNGGFFNQRDMMAHRDVVHDTAAPFEWAQFCACSCKLKYCETCSKYFRDDERFLSHECQKDDSNETAELIEQLLKSKPCYKCDTCSICFHWKWMYRLHRENVHRIAAPFDWNTLSKEEIAFYCQFCMQAFDNEDTLNEHTPSCAVNRDSLVKPFACSLCDRSFMRKSDLRRHLRNKHPQPGVTDVNDRKKKSPIQCPYCDVQMKTRRAILKHAKDAHDVIMNTPFVCVTCNKIFKRKETMEMHYQIYHPKVENTEEIDKLLKEAEFLLDGEIAYHCTTCKRILPDSAKFLAHHRLHQLERKFTCDLCGKQTRTQHQLNTHIKFIHLNIRNFQCDLCEKSFHSKQSCEEHRRIHTGERPFSCEICGKTFIALNALFTHKKFHNDFFAHPCHMCDKKFKIRRSLINHIRTHTGERPYKCELCSKTFNNSSRFSYHKKVTHSDNRPFTCNQCGSCFKANKFLQRHMKLHTIRTHVQLRRRNNPNYFANHDANLPKNSKSVSESQEKSNQGSTIEVTNGGESDVCAPVAAPESQTARKMTYHEVNNVDIGDNLDSADTEVLVLSEHDAKKHFLAQALTDSSNRIDPLVGICQ